MERGWHLTKLRWTAGRGAMPVVAADLCDYGDVIVEFPGMLARDMLANQPGSAQKMRR